MQIRAAQAGITTGLARTGRSIWDSGLELLTQFRVRAEDLVPSLRRDRHSVQFALWILIHVGIWWAAAVLLYAPSDIHNDMAEAFAWGRDLQWGYYKHPPFWAWTARVWFSIFPTVDWAFYLLSVVNSAVGLIGVWAIAGRYLSGSRRLAAVLLLELVPFNHVLAFTFNANSIQLSLWPWTLYAFIVSFETRRVWAAVAFAVLAAASILSKYFGGILLASCLIAALTNPSTGKYVRSAAPYVTIAAFALCIAPHLAWLMRTSNGPLDYLATKTAYPFPFIVEKAATFVAGTLLLHGLLAIVLLVLWLRSHRPDVEPAPTTLAVPLAQPAMRLPLVLAVAPLLVTIAVALGGNVRLGTKFALPLFSLIPLALIILGRARFGRQAMSVVAVSAGLTMVGFLMLSIPTAIVKFRSNHRHFADPRALVAREVTRLWHDHENGPLRIVSGTEAYALAATFYGDDHPSDFIDLSMTKAPWITEARLRREGLAIVCLSTDRECLLNIERFAALQSARFTLGDVSKSFLWFRGKSSSFVVLLVKPGQTIDRRVLMQAGQE